GEGNAERRGPDPNVASLRSRARERRDHVSATGVQVAKPAVILLCGRVKSTVAPALRIPCPSRRPVSTRATGLVDHAPISRGHPSPTASEAFTVDGTTPKCSSVCTAYAPARCWCDRCGVRRRRRYAAGMSERRRYKKRKDRPVVAIRLDLDTDGFEYRKWDDVQRCKRGDWIVDNDGDIYTIDARSF